MDEKNYSDQNIDVVLTKIGLNLDKNIYLVRAFEEDMQKGKKYIRNIAILVSDELLTSTFTDTVHFLEELYLFDSGNEQNRYLEIVEHKKTKNLRLKLENSVVYISKSEARAMHKLFNLSIIGYSMTRVLEFEYRFTPESLTQALYHNDYLQLARQKMS